MIHFSCPECLETHQAPDVRAGERTRCSRCGAALRIPGPRMPDQRPPDDTATWPCPRAGGVGEEQDDPLSPVPPIWEETERPNVGVPLLISLFIVGSLSVVGVVLVVAHSRGPDGPPGSSKPPVAAAPVSSAAASRTAPPIASRPQPVPQPAMPARDTSSPMPISGAVADPPRDPLTQGGNTSAPPTNQPPPVIPAVPEKLPIRENRSTEPGAVAISKSPLGEPVVTAAKDDEPTANRKPATPSPVPGGTGKEEMKKDDLPDVALQIPEETRPETKAILIDNATRLRSRSPGERERAAHVLGELSDQGKPARRLLCNAMLDITPSVRVAAADALKKIDAKLQYLAVALATERDSYRRLELLERVAKLEDDGEPLTPLVAAYARERFPSHLGTRPLQRIIATLSYIARADPWVYRQTAAALDNRDPEVRRVAVNALTRLKHGRQAVTKIIAILKYDEANRIPAIEALSVLADQSTEDAIREAIAAQRYHPREEVRRAVEVALNKLQNKAGR